MHPFVQAMSDFLIESGRRAARLGIVTSMMRSAAAKYDEDAKIMMSYVNASEHTRRVIKWRRLNAVFQSWMIAGHIRRIRKTF